GEQALGGCVGHRGRRALLLGPERGLRGCGREGRQTPLALRDERGNQGFPHHLRGGRQTVRRAGSWLEHHELRAAIGTRFGGGVWKQLKVYTLSHEVSHEGNVNFHFSRVRDCCLWTNA